MVEQGSLEAQPTEVNMTEFTAAVLCRISERPLPFQTLTKLYGVKRNVFSSSSYRLTSLRLILHHRDKGGWAAGELSIVRLIPNRWGRGSNIPVGTKVVIMPSIFGERRGFILGEAYNLDEIAEDARRCLAAQKTPDKG